MSRIRWTSNLNVSSKIYGVYECDIVTALNTYDFVIKDFVIKKGVLFVPNY